MSHLEPSDVIPTPAPERPPGGGQDGLIAFLKDNLEAIAVAVVMALVIKHFCVEAFKIPTESMNPTLLGEKGNPQGEGDRILVDKFAYLFTSPKRWDVIVFRYPLDRSRNFIKRIAGVAGERLRISRDGDLWVRPAGKERDEEALRIPQKPRRVREQFYLSVYPPVDVEAPIASELNHNPRLNMERYFRPDEGTPQNAWRLEDHGLFVFVGGPKAVLRNAPAIRENSRADSWALSGNSGDLVRDVRIALTVELDAADAEGEATLFSIGWRADDHYKAAIQLGSGGSKAPSRAGITKGMAVVRTEDLDVTLEPGASYAVELEYVDGMLRVHVNGEELAALPDDRRFAETRESGREQQLTLSASGGALKVKNLRIDRDLRYENEWTGNHRGQRDGVDVPADSYFMLGDNTHNSSDSRRWRTTMVHLKGGRTITIETSAESYADDDYKVKEAKDVDGILRTWHEDDEDGDKGSPVRPAPFVHRDLIVGRAFLVFWPCFPEFPGRLGLIH